MSPIVAGSGTAASNTGDCRRVNRFTPPGFTPASPSGTSIAKENVVTLIRGALPLLHSRTSG